MNKVTKKIFDYEDNVKRWIETYRGRWYSILFILGFVLGYFFCYLAQNENGITFGFLLGFILIVIEFFAGGSGSL